MKDREIGMFRWFSRYGFETDVFDLYREAVCRSNRISLRVLSVLGLAYGLALTAYGFVTEQPAAWPWFCLALLLTSGLAFAAAWKPQTSGKLLLGAGYLLSISLFTVCIYGSIALETHTFWAGMAVAAGCFLLDYAWRMGLLELLSYLALTITWIARQTPVTDERFLSSLLYLTVSLVTFYTVNRTRVSLIIGREENRKQADTDPLTGLMSRETAQEAIEDHLEASKENGALILLDIDRFRSVNEQLGRETGDRLLADVSADLKRTFRNSDVLCRLGGDEFLIYMKAAPEEEWVRKRVDELVRTVRRWVTDGTTNLQTTASVGVVLTDGVERVYEDMYRAADIAMYFSKAQGGNQAVFYTKDLVSQARTAAAARTDPANPDAKTLAEHNGTHRD